MQNSLPVPHTVAEFVYLSVVGIFASIGTYLATRKSKSDTERTRAETRSIDLATTLHAGDMMVKLIEESGRQALKSEQLKQKKEYWEQRALAAEAARDLAENQLDEHIRIGRNTPPKLT